MSKDEIIHPHERAGRAEKVARLVETIDRYNAKVEDPHLHVDAEFLAATIQNDALWRILAGVAGTRLPSFTTRQHVESYLRTRADAQARRDAGEDPFEGLF